ncbi:DUF6332 family protein [Streptomyces sp. ODS28]|uniref:DUF6332 family protein n=1 Tax=Streptomyces sp. ODS28 TaxID=3136688 RepID=UPI0031ECBE09
MPQHRTGPSTQAERDATTVEMVYALVTGLALAGPAFLAILLFPRLTGLPPGPLWPKAALWTAALIFTARVVHVLRRWHRVRREHGPWDDES